MTAPMRLLALFVTIFGATDFLAAVDEPGGRTADRDDTPAVAESPVDVERIRAWVSDLDSNDFDARQVATERLIEAGEAAVPAVAAAAETDDLEMATRCLGILKRLYQSDEAATRAAAEEALAKLAKSERRSVAQRAAAATARPEPVPAAPFGNVQIQVRGIQVAAGAGGMRMQVRNVNGQRDIRVEQNGQKIEIADTNGKNITVKITEMAGGKEKTREFKGADLEDLRKKHPEGAKLYERYASGRNGVQRIRGVGGAIQIRAVPVPLPVLPVPPAVPAVPPPAQGADPLRQTDEHLRQTIENLRSMAEKTPAQAAELNRVADDLEKTRERLNRREKP